MTDIHLRALSQIKRRLNDLFFGHIDMSDVLSGDTDQEVHFCSRALVSLFVKSVSGISEAEAGTYVTDQFNDQGIDGLYYHQSSKTLYLVQSKWKQNPSKGLEQADWLKFKVGLLNILNLDMSEFGPKVRQFEPTLQQALEDIDTKVRGIVIATIHTKISRNIGKDVEKLVRDQNQYSSDFLTIEFLDLKRISDLARIQARSAPIDVEIALTEWGEISEPYSAIYGTVAADDIASWFSQYKDLLFRENLRFVLDKSDVNARITQTLRDTPSSFWYFNNGITAICNRYAKKPIGGSKKDTGFFKVDGISIVNGAQTVGAIGTTKAAGVDLSDCRAFLRIIALENTPDGFARLVTQANNTQNEVQLIDFAALDDAQLEIQKKLKRIGIDYAYRRGETEPNPTTGCDLRSATIALACANPDLKLAVSAKRYISGLWNDTTKEPYTTLFNDGLKAEFLWNAVQIMRIVDNELDTQAKKLTGKDRLIAIHGNRFILHCVHRYLRQEPGHAEHNIDPAFEQRIRQETRELLTKTIAATRGKYPDSYAGNVFKNVEKQLELSQEIAEVGQDGIADLFA